MAEITFKGTPFHTVGELPAVGEAAPDFKLADDDLNDKTLGDYAGRKVALSIVPSLDTSVCAASARRFNEEASALGDIAVLNVSMDLPFAQKRFCEVEGIERVEPLSAFRSPAFGQAYGVTIQDGPLAGLLSRAVVVVDAEGIVAYTEQVPEIAQEPDYERVLSALQ